METYINCVTGKTEKLKPYIDKKGKIINTDIFCSDENYYLDSWLNGNKMHVLTHLQLFRNDNILYNRVLIQFIKHPEILSYIFNWINTNYFNINKSYI